MSQYRPVFSVKVRPNRITYPPSAPQKLAGLVQLNAMPVKTHALDATTI